MRTPFAHVAAVALAPGGDSRAPGGAITIALCGSSQHEPPCPLAAHAVEAVPDGDLLRIRILFATAPGDEAEVRRRIDGALATGEHVGPDGSRSRWRVVGEGEAAPVADAEREHAERLART